MGFDDNGDFGFQQRVGILPYSGTYMVSRSEKVVQETTMNPYTMCKSSNGVDSLYVTCCDPLVSLSQNFEFKSSSMDSHHQAAISSFSSDVMENQGVSSSSHFLQYSSSPNLVDQAPKFPCFGNGSFTEMLSSLCLPECDQIANAGGFADCPSNKKGTKTTTNSPKLVDQGVISQGDLTASSMGVRRLGPNGKKRKKKVPENHAGGIHSQFDSVPCVDEEQLNDVSMEPIEGLKEQDEKKPKNERNLVSNMCGKLNSKQNKDSSKNAKAPKEDYFHVRARRGQATNSHSLAERVRREKISERMKLLQDLVPGCDKINGKALMLEEIINYVQTLQRQVEFLSMKLATVNPELNIDIERILRRDILHSHGGNSASATQGINPEMSYSHSQSQPHLTPRANIHAIQSTDPNLPPMSRLPGVWDDELGSVLQMGLVSNTALSSSELNGHMKLEL